MPKACCWFAATSSLFTMALSRWQNLDYLESIALCIFVNAVLSSIRVKLNVRRPVEQVRKNEDNSHYPKSKVGQNLS